MATADEYAAWIVKNADKKGTPDFETVARAYQAAKAQTSNAAPTTYDPSEGGGTLQLGPFDTGIKTPQWLDRTLAGTGKAFADLGTGVAQLGAGIADTLAPRQPTLAGLITGQPKSRVQELRDRVAEERQLSAPLMATTAGKVGNVLGNVAAVAPAALIPGAQTIGGGALVGAASGLLQPSTSTGETIKNVAVGGAAGAAVPAAVRGYQAARSLAEPLYAEGQDAIIGRALNRVAGNDAGTVAQRLREASAPFTGPSQGAVQRTTMGELVPGSVPTVGQAAQNAGVASLERAATAANPDVTNAVSDVMRQQNAARVGLLNDLAGTDGARTFAAANRDATADQLYGAARRLGVDPAKLTPEALQNVAQFSQKIPDDVLAYAKRLAKINGEQMTDATSIQGMHWVKKAIDGLISKESGPGGDSTLKAAYTGLQSDLLQGMDNLSPAYAAARKVYADMSRPINQMDVGQAIIDKSVNKLSGNLQPNALANALVDKTAARATGFPGATLEGTMTNAQMNSLNSLLADVQRSTAAQNAGRGVGSDTVQKLAYTNMLDSAGVPSFVRDLAPAQILGNLASRAGDAVYGRAGREISNELAEVMLDPARAAQLMRSATPAQRNALAQILQRSASGLMLSAPSATNALQQ
jgi:hypothetical protein